MKLVEEGQHVRRDGIDADLPQLEVGRVQHHSSRDIRPGDDGLNARARCLLLCFQLRLLSLLGQLRLLALANRLLGRLVQGAQNQAGPDEPAQIHPESDSQPQQDGSHPASAPAQTSEG